jgi:MFS family permease
MPELWVVFAVKFLAVGAYAIMNSTLVLWLSADLGYSDENASYLVAAWSISMTVFTVLVGSLTDAIGLRKTFLLGVWVCVAARLVMTFTTIPWLALAGGLVPLALGEALGTPVLVAAIRKYSTTAQRSISFSIFYIMMNVGFLGAGLIFDLLRRQLGEHATHTLPLVNIGISTYQALFLASLAIEVALIPILYFGIREGAEATDEGVHIAPERSRNLQESFWSAICRTVQDTVRDTGRNFAALGRQSGFYRLLGFLMLIAFVKLIYMQMYYAYPKFGIRELGEGAPIGQLWTVTNAALIILLVPVVGVLTQKLSAYRVVTFGTAISAASVFILALPPAWFQGMADGTLGHWLGHGYLRLSGEVNPWYVMIFFYVVLLSVGEAFYSPRVYEYAASIAPQGQEASYGALSYVPFFLAKLIVGGLSGTLLARYCPETGPRDSSTMWLIIALITTIAPVGLLVLRRWIRVQEAGRED